MKRLSKKGFLKRRLTHPKGAEELGKYLKRQKALVLDAGCGEGIFSF
jgi:2-polyprenyl-3-methyl-5-hydroxy-6-metoxy-1,4-benzoquinol methylase